MRECRAASFVGSTLEFGRLRFQRRHYAGSIVMMRMALPFPNFTVGNVVESDADHRRANPDVGDGFQIRD